MRRTGEAGARRPLAGTSRSISSLKGCGKFRKLWPKPASITMSPAASGTAQPATLCVSSRNRMGSLQQAFQKQNLYCFSGWGRTPCRQDSHLRLHRTPRPALKAIAAPRKLMRLPLPQRQNNRPPETENLHLTQAWEVTLRRDSERSRLDWIAGPMLAAEPRSPSFSIERAGLAD